MPKLELSKLDKKKGMILPKKIDSNLAYFCGILAGDGNINYRPSKKEFTIKCVGNPKDEKKFYLEIIQPLIKLIFGINVKMKTFDSNTTFGFIIYSKTLVTYLTEIIGLPLGKKYSKLKIPPAFLEEKHVLLNFIKGVFDTDGCICFKKKYKTNPYYPVITVSSKSEPFIKEISKTLKQFQFNFYEVYNYKVSDKRNSKGFTLINRIELNGEKNLKMWLNLIGLNNPKHIYKIKKNWEEK